MEILVNVPDLGDLSTESGFTLEPTCSDGIFEIGKKGVASIVSTKDQKLEIISFKDESLAYVKSSLGYPAYYRIHPLKETSPVKAVLMDLDGTTVRSEEFWIWIIEKTIKSLLESADFKFVKEDFPFVSGHSVSEHLDYCINKYCPNKTIEAARSFYFKHTTYEMNEIMNGRGVENAFVPTKGVKAFLLELKAMGIKIGLVTSGLYEKAYPEILSAFNTLKMGEPTSFYDSIITAGYPLRAGSVGTLGELSPKPHPWLYAETCTVGLGIDFLDRGSVIGIEDSGAGVYSLRLAGYKTIGISGGNIIDSGAKELCYAYCDTFEEILEIIKEQHNRSEG